MQTPSVVSPIRSSVKYMVLTVYVNGRVEYVNVCCVAFHVLVDVKGADTPGPGNWKMGALVHGCRWCTVPRSATHAEVWVSVAPETVMVSICTTIGVALN